MDLIKICEWCGEKYKVRCPSIFGKRRFCSKSCSTKLYNTSRILTKESKRKISEAMMGDKNPNWKGGVYKTTQGYIVLKRPKHPKCDRDGYVFEHRLVMEKYLGRYLKPEEIVHHIDRNKENNSIKNLMLFKNAREHLGYMWQLSSPVKFKKEKETRWDMQ